MENSEKLNLSQVKYQYLAVVCVNLITICQGFSIGWVSPSLQTLRSEDTPLKTGPITLHETVLLTVLPSLGGMIGIAIFSVLSKHMGRIATISLTAFPNMTFWIVLLTSNSINIILIGRFIVGLAWGGLYLCIPLFVAEIANRRIRGFLCLILNLSLSLGILMSYICGAYLDYDHVPMVIIPFPVIFLVSLIILPETPSSLLRQNKIEAAKKSLQFYNNGNDSQKNGFDTDAEIEKLQIVVNQRELDRQQGNWKLILTRKSLTGICTGLILAAIVAFSGCNACASYVSDWFAKSNVNFDANLSAIIVGVLNVLGTACSAVVIDSWGRRKLFGLCCTLAGAALMVFGTFSYLNSSGVNVASFYWVPVTCTSSFIFVSAAGLRPLVSVYTAEMLPSNIRNTGSTICMFAFTLFLLISSGTMPIFVQTCPLQVVMWTYGGISLLGLVFSVFVMHETKGKNINDGK